MTLAPLAGYAVAITADRRAEEQATLLSRLGASVLHGPVIRTRPLSEDVGAATERVIANPPDVLAVITALGIRGWFSAAESLGLGDRLLDALTLTPAGDARDLVVLARGPKAAGAALSLGLDVTWRAPQARSSEVFDRIRSGASRPLEPGTRIAILLDGAPDADIVDEVAAFAPGLDVVAVPVYRWELPDDPAPAHRLINAVVERSVDAVTFTSSHAVTNFATLTEQLGLIDDVRSVFERGDVVPVAVGPVTACRVDELGFTTPVEPRTFRLGAMVQALAGAFRDQAVELRLAGFDVRVQGRLVKVDAEEPALLTEREQAVFAVLSRRPGVVVSKGELRREVWDNGADDHAVEVTVGRLRRRLGPAADGIETVMRRGYRLTPS
jgi:uroporphyrinogen-III synthase